MATLNSFLMKNAGSVCETQECWDLGEIENWQNSCSKLVHIIYKNAAHVGWLQEHSIQHAAAHTYEVWHECENGALC